MTEFFTRLKQHHIYRVAAAYGAAIAVLIQIVARAFPYFGWSAAVPAVIIILIAGFPVALVIAWLWVKPADAGEQSAGRKRNWKLGAIVTPIVIAAVVVSGIYAFRFSAEHEARLAAAQLAATTASTAAPSAATEIPAKSIAVLPLVNESGDKDQQYFSDGLSEDLITALSQFAGLKVINRDSSFQFRDSKDSVQAIGEKLGVAHLLEGSVQKSGDEVRISAELVNCTDGSTLWSQHYDRPYKDLFALQDAITKSVADALQAKLLTAPGAVIQSDRPPSGNLAAYAAFLRARSDSSQRSGAGFQAAIKALDEAVQLDPRYAAAYAMLGDMWTAGYRLAGSKTLAQNDAANAHAAIRTALALDPDLAIAHANHAYILSSIDLDWNGALTECRKALQLTPNDAAVKACLADASATHGELDKAIKLTRAVLKTDPRSANRWHWLGHYLFALGRLDEAERATRRQIGLAPQGSNSYQQLAVIEVLRGNAGTAMRLARQESSGGWRRFAVALAAQIGPDRAVADAALKDLIANGGADTMAYQIAEVYALRRDPDAMFKWLDRAWSNRDPGVGTLLYTPFILRYRDDPRFAAFSKQVGLPTTTDAVAMK